MAASAGQRSGSHPFQVHILKRRHPERFNFMLFGVDIANRYQPQRQALYDEGASLCLFSSFFHLLEASTVFICCNVTNRCKPGFFNLQPVNPEGCQPCFCLGHSLACSSSNHFAAVDITSDFMEGIIRGSAWLFSLPITAIISTAVILCNVKDFCALK